MKKLLILILLMTFPMLTSAKEVKLSCNIHNSDEGQQKIEIHSFDESAGTVDGHKVEKTCVEKADPTSIQCRYYMISDSEFGFGEIFGNGDVWGTEISRIDGTFKEFRAHYSKYRGFEGTCVPFKQAF